MLAITVKSAVKCHLFTLPQLPEEPAPAAEKNPRGNTVSDAEAVCGWLRNVNLLVCITF